ncbi:unnamed protein product [Blepharisma stoltei]|uniref:Histidine kinase n=1 Tax=Blepharisma stoltei TaxID=1481888 RepID=A0AAU9JS80_9CILI|nr:unnamed protein product [Blepharisma stoltei]
MEKERRLWWEEEVNENYRILKKVNYSRLVLISICWVFYITGTIWLSCDWSGYIIFCAKISFAQLVVCIIMEFLENKGAFAKSFFAILLSEFSCSMWWVFGREAFKSSELLFSNVSLAYTNICEWPFILSPFFRIVILCKHVFMWHYHNYYKWGFDLRIEETMSHYLSILLVVMCDLYIRNIKATSFERFLSRKNLERAEKRFSVIFNLFPDGILILSGAHSILYINAVMTRFLGCSKDRVVQTLSTIEYCQGKKYSHLSNSNKLIDDLILVPSLEVNQEVVLGLSKIQNSNLEFRAQKVLWDDHDAILLTVRDANHIINLEQSISDNKLKNVLLRSVSHELRTPINAITSLSEALMSEPEIVQNKKFKENLNIVSVSSKLLLSLVNDLLDYSRILAGAFSVQKTNCLIRAIVQDAVQLLKTQAEKKGLIIFSRIDPQMPAYIYTDSLRLSQVILNLLSNALKFTLKGHIEICCLLVTKGVIKIIISDTGIGIEESNLPNLFKEFNTHTNQTINPTGCGLGLFISNIIVKELGPKPIEVSSTLGEGSSFSFFINIHEDELAQSYYEELHNNITSENISQIVPKDFSKLIEKEYPQVLIVDDNDFNRIAIGSLLLHCGILYNESYTGKEAVKKIQESCRIMKPYKLVIMDGSMPELNGWEATKMIHQLYFDGKLSSLPIIIGYTAFSSEEELNLCIESGMKECLIKPCSKEVLISKVLHYLSL